MSGRRSNMPDWVERASALECRGCEVVCERVVFPGHCLKSACKYVYAVQDYGSTFFGCIHRVFAAELDVAPFQESNRVGLYGALRAHSTPRRECRAGVEKGYAFRYSWNGCVNPVFLRDPAAFTPEAVRRLVNGPDGGSGP
ncbi:MAG: hypothetical protein ACYC33_01425 [Thermoleophilia bacterium]